ncbi:GNAT family N-acetyltransferase [Pseudomonas luteola]|uniref:GNAT family N-acetyltransferase n=1 Tax=Pseudomonas luteola TaxID=47886 RepID=UPI00123B0C51|nr:MULTISPECIES: GNAT family N-acetyltransferase [Pseudomonas]MBA1249043.1 GNAT family N-acetyltransferase [Pseudomonas zeshuii]QEU30634.1 GNAT family N-acetyltransferase [Pseudomonas luteola]
MSIRWIATPQIDLTVQTLYAILALRTEVFVVEQKCPYQEVDGQDLTGNTYHLMGWEGDTLVAYLRVLDPVLHDGQVVIGRVVTAPAARGRGLGHELMKQGLTFCETHWAGLPIYLSAQAHLQDYYGCYDFEPVTDIYLEDDIPHIGMRRTATS